LFVLAAIGTIPIAVIQASLFEWAFHRYWLHRPWLPKDCFTAHTLVHHQLCKFDDTFHVVDEEQHEALTFQWWGGPVLIAINLVPWALLTWALAATGVMPPNFGPLVAVAVVFGLYYAGYEGFHYLMHKPTIPWIERSAYFRFLERHHRIHHHRMDRNLNVLVPIADFLFRTLVLEAPPARATPEAARVLARRHMRRRHAAAGETTLSREGIEIGPDSASSGQ
jgi:hypothetical protein